MKNYKEKVERLKWIFKKYEYKFERINVDNKMLNDLMYQCIKRCMIKNVFKLIGVKFEYNLCLAIFKLGNVVLKKVG